jgi:hypothetical protein
MTSLKNKKAALLRAVFFVAQANNPNAFAIDGRFVPDEQHHG